MSEKNSELTFEIGMDENNVPEKIVWKASDSEDRGACDAAFLTIWDTNEKNTLRIDLWTKDMQVDDMKIFVHQMLLSLSDTYQRATNDEQNAKEIKQFALELGEKMDILKRGEE
jgi:gliding motility-associated protein GldC